jgi:NAD(P)-dependent dehydrogenase (short-subunit alcohol dehydrogenase family)
VPWGLNSPLTLSSKEITAQLLIHDIEKVFVLARTVSKFEHARQEWNERRGIKLLDSSIRAEFVPCDLGDIPQARKAAEEIIKRTSRLDIVVCNAGPSESFWY